MKINYGGIMTDWVKGHQLDWTYKHRESEREIENESERVSQRDAERARICVCRKMNDGELTCQMLTYRPQFRPRLYSYAIYLEPRVESDIFLWQDWDRDEVWALWMCVCKCVCYCQNTYHLLSQRYEVLGNENSWSSLDKRTQKTSSLSGHSQG